MGHHFLPRSYLRAFATKNDPDAVWIYVKGAPSPRRVPTRKLAQAKNYFTPEQEVWLAREIEAPANPILRQLRAGLPIGRDDRERVVQYLGSMLARVPRRRRKHLEGIPEVVRTVVEEFQQAALTLGEKHGAQELAQRRVDEAEAMKERSLKQYPPVLVEQALVPWVSEGVLDIIRRMSWRLIESHGPRYFITSDNPMFFFEGLGLGGPQSEFVFPLSPLRAIHGSWQVPPKGRDSLLVNQDIVNEINLRIVTTTERLVVYSERVPWIAPLLQRDDQAQISRIHWE